MRKPNNEELEFVEKSLKELKIQLDRIIHYIQENPWTAMDTNTKSTEFKFQTELFNNHTKWMNSYLELSGIYDFYTENNKKEEKQIRKGYEENITMDILKGGNLDELIDEQ